MKLRFKNFNRNEKILLHDALNSLAQGTLDCLASHCVAEPEVSFDTLRIQKIHKLATELNQEPLTF